MKSDWYGLSETVLGIRFGIDLLNPPKSSGPRMAGIAIAFQRVRLVTQAWRGDALSGNLLKGNEFRSERPFKTQTPVSSALLTHPAFSDLTVSS